MTDDPTLRALAHLAAKCRRRGLRLTPGQAAALAPELRRMLDTGQVRVTTEQLAAAVLLLGTIDARADCEALEWLHSEQATAWAGLLDLGKRWPPGPSQLGTRAELTRTCPASGASVRRRGPAPVARLCDDGLGGLSADTLRSRQRERQERLG